MLEALLEAAPGLDLKADATIGWREAVYEDTGLPFEMALAKCLPRTVEFLIVRGQCDVAHCFGENKSRTVFDVAGGKSYFFVDEGVDLPGTVEVLIRHGADPN